MNQSPYTCLRLVSTRLSPTWHGFEFQPWIRSRPGSRGGEILAWHADFWVCDRSWLSSGPWLLGRSRDQISLRLQTTDFTQKVAKRKGNGTFVFQGNLGWWNTIIWPDGCLGYIGNYITQVYRDYIGFFILKLKLGWKIPVFFSGRVIRRIRWKPTWAMEKGSLVSRV